MAFCLRLHRPKGRVEYASRVVSEMNGVTLATVLVVFVVVAYISK